MSSFRILFALSLSWALATPLTLLAQASPDAPGQAPAETAERRGDTAEQAGRWETAFSAYLNAFQSLTEPRTVADDHRLREKIIKVVQRMETRPVVPQAARQHLEKAESIVAAEAILGGSASAASQEAAASELRQALRIAPWSPDAAFLLATVLQKLQRFDEAVLNLSLYKLADPAGYTAMLARVSPTPAAPVPAAAPEIVPGPPPPAVIYVYWPEQQRGGSRKKVRCNTREVADLQNNRFLALNAAAGTHVVSFDGEEITAVVESGRQYHYRASLEGHWQFAQGATLRQVSAGAAAAEMREQEMTLNDARRTFSTECAAAPPTRARPR